VPLPPRGLIKHVGATADNFAMSSVPREGIHVNRHDDYLHFTAVLDDKVVDIKLWPESARNLAGAIQQLAAEAESHGAHGADHPKRLWSRP
jgi:hypothetical protein